MAGVTRGRRREPENRRKTRGVILYCTGNCVADVCKYKKGTWSKCNTLTKLETRTDSLKAGASGSSCAQSRQLTRNCRDRQAKSEGGPGGCVYDKARSADWSECQSGVRKKVLALKSGSADCPREKIISKKCKNGEKKEKNKKNKKGNVPEEKKMKEQKQNGKKKNQQTGEEKCGFGPWSEYSQCTGGKQERTRQVTKGKDLKACKKQATEKKKC